MDQQGRDRRDPVFADRREIPRGGRRTADEDPLLTVSEAAALLHVTKKTLYRHIAKGALRVKYVGPFRRVRVLRSEVECYGRLLEHGYDPT